MLQSKWGNQVGDRAKRLAELIEQVKNEASDRWRCRDKTSLVQAWLASGAPLTLANLDLIGELEDPLAIWLTDWESPLLWSAWGTFVLLSSDAEPSKARSDWMTILSDLVPRAAPFTRKHVDSQSVSACPDGYYDNWKVRIWTVYMPTSGDANTYGASELFGGRVADTTIERGVIHFQVIRSSMWSTRNCRATSSS